MLKTAFEKSFLSFKKVLFPDKCSVCAELFNALEPLSVSDLCNMEIEAAQKRILAESICEKCIGEFIPVKEPYCLICGGMFKSRKGTNHKCYNCIEKKAEGRVRSVGIYEGTLLELIHRLKYNSRVYLAEVLGKILFLKMLGMTEEDGFDIVIPVPLYKGKMRKRGFNQSVLLVKGWKKWFNDFGLKVKIEPDAVTRIKNTKTQIGLSAKERKANLKNAFKADDIVRNKKVLLIDDVYTTGSTVESIKGALIRKGALTIDVLTIARTGQFIK